MLRNISIAEDHKLNRQLNYYNFRIFLQRKLKKTLSMMCCTKEK